MGERIKSNVTGEDIQPIVDRTALTDDQKMVLSEVLEILEGTRGKSTAASIDNLKIQFNVAEVPMMKIEDSLWHQMTKDERIGPSIQGFKQIKDKDGNDLRIPHIAFSADLDYLDEMLNRILLKLQNLKPVDIKKD
jgi:hypothetical protein